MSLKAFFKEAAIRPENVKTVISSRFVGEDGRALEWELRPLSEPEHAKIKEGCTQKQIMKRHSASKFDGPGYTLRLTIASVVFPDLADAELQKSYGVVGEEALLMAMLMPGEMTELQQQVQFVNGFEQNQLEEDVGEVKNS